LLAALHTGELGLLFALSLVSTALVGALMPRVRPAIVRLQLAWSPACARRIIDCWAAAASIKRAKRSVHLDYAFLVGYAATLALLVLLAARAADASGLMSEDTADTFALVGALAMVGAGALDAVENVGLLVMLGGRISRAWTVFTTLCAGTKFALVIAGVVTALVVLAAALVESLT
jgi:hypothetical protein